MQGYGGGVLTLESDGGCEPNPGEGQIGVVVKKDGVTCHEISARIGHATNNIAEWQAAIRALDYAVGYTMAYPERNVELRMDSQLVVYQLTGRWKTKNAGLKPLLTKGQALLSALKEQGVTVRVYWIPREQNRDADALTASRNWWDR